MTIHMPRIGLIFFKYFILSIYFKYIILHIPCGNSSRLLVLSHFTEKETGQEGLKKWPNDIQLANGSLSFNPRLSNTEVPDLLYFFPKY